MELKDEFVKFYQKVREKKWSVRSDNRFYFKDTRINKPLICNFSVKNSFFIIEKPIALFNVKSNWITEGPDYIASLENMDALFKLDDFEVVRLYEDSEVLKNDSEEESYSIEFSSDGSENVAKTKPNEAILEQKEAIIENIDVSYEKSNEIIREIDESVKSEKLDDDKIKELSKSVLDSYQILYNLRKRGIKKNTKLQIEINIVDEKIRKSKNLFNDIKNNFNHFDNNQKILELVQSEIEIREKERNDLQNKIVDITQVDKFFHQIKKEFGQSKDFDNICKICYDRQITHATSCGHTFCNQCIQSLNNKCPNCRKSIYGTSFKIYI